MKPREVMIAIPSTADAVKVGTMRMICNAMLEGLRESVAFNIPQMEAIVPISAARNFALSLFLASECDDLFFVDDDIVSENGAMLRLLKHPVDFVAAIYPHRDSGDDKGATFPVQWATAPVANGEMEIWQDLDTGLLEVHGVPAGFLRMRRSVVERMVQAYPDLWYYQRHAPNGKAPDLFDFELREHCKYSEDFTFCKRWRDIGGKVWVDPDIGFAHIGPKAFFGRLADRYQTPVAKEAAE